MKIRFIRTISTDRQCFVRTAEEDLPEAEALRHVKAGHAVPIGTCATPPPVQVAEEVRVKPQRKGK